MNKEHYPIFLYEKQNRQCYYCAKPFWDGEKVLPYGIDHVIPKARGGGNHIGNLVLACTECNQIKGSSTADSFREVLVMMKEGKIKTKKDAMEYATYLTLKGKFDLPANKYP